jgi:hypothetical protein
VCVCVLVASDTAGAWLGAVVGTRSKASSLKHRGGIPCCRHSSSDAVHAVCRQAAAWLQECVLMWIAGWMWLTCHMALTSNIASAGWHVHAAAVAWLAACCDGRGLWLIAAGSALYVHLGSGMFLRVAYTTLSHCHVGHRG